MINKTKLHYIKPIVDYLKNHTNKYNKLVVYGESIDPNVVTPSTIDFAVGLVDENIDITNSKELGELLFYISSIINDGDFTLIPMCKDLLTESCWNDIQNGQIIFES